MDALFNTKRGTRGFNWSTHSQIILAALRDLNSSPVVVGNEVQHLRNTSRKINGTSGTKPSEVNEKW